MGVHIPQGDWEVGVYSPIGSNAVVGAIKKIIWLFAPEFMPPLSLCFIASDCPANYFVVKFDHHAVYKQ